MSVLLANNKVKSLKESLRKEFSEGKYSGNEKIESIRDIAARFNVSKHTVSQAISLLSAEGVLRQEQGRGTFFNGLDNNPQTKNAIALYMTVRDGQNEYVQNVIRGVSAVAQKNETDFLLYTDRPHGIIEKADSLRGLVVFYDGDVGTIAELHSVFEKVPAVFVDCECPGLMNSYVALDNEKAGFMAAEHLLQQGHRKIGFIGWPSQTRSTIRDRISGIKMAMFKYGVQPEDKWFGRDLVDDPDNAFHVGKCIDKLMAQDDLTALICVNDPIALCAHNYLQKKGIKVPEDMALVCFDDSVMIQAHGLTSVRQNGFDFGQKAAEIIFNNEHNQRILFEPELKVRASSLT